jgi:hypothetical protein
MTDASLKALSVLRDPSHLQWYVVPLLALAVYLYAVEVERKSWDLVLTGLILWTGEFL